jgi:hypothetical protein
MTTKHPFVTTPNNGPCSSCGQRRSAAIHDWSTKDMATITISKAQEWHVGERITLDDGRVGIVEARYNAPDPALMNYLVRFL